MIHHWERNEKMPEDWANASLYSTNAWIKSFGVCHDRGIFAYVILNQRSSGLDAGFRFDTIIQMQRRLRKDVFNSVCERYMLDGLIVREDKRKALTQSEQQSLEDITRDVAERLLPLVRLREL